MTKLMITMKSLALLCALAFAVAPAQAQTRPTQPTTTRTTGSPDRGFVAINFGGQPQTHTFTESLAPQIYGESASITVPHSVGGGALFDVAAGALFGGGFGIGIGFSRFSKDENPTVSAQIPNPLFTDSPRSATTSAGELSHSETGVHLQLLYVAPVTDSFSVTAMLGPSFTKVNQGLVTGVTPTEGAPPFTTVSIGSVATSSASGWAKGLNIGLDLSYAVIPNAGVGFFLRYVGGSADLPSEGGTVSVKVGGFQTGVGLRVRF
jgi:hypothetical protein